MRKTLVLTLLLLCSLMVSSCDFFRQLAGRPVSSDIQARRELIQKAETERLEKQRIEDSIQTGLRRQAELAAAEDSLRHELLVVPSSRIRVPAGSIVSRYLIVLGSFSNADNARRLAAKLESAGHEPVLIRYSSGSTWVCTCPSDNLVDIGKAFESLKAQDFFPANAWILEDRR